MKLLSANTILAGAMVLSVALPALAAEEAKAPQERMSAAKTEQSAAMEKPGQVSKLNGEIAAVDHAAKMVTVKAKRNGKDITVAALVDDQTGIRDGRNTKSLSELKVGERVRIYYENQGKRELARNILVQPKGK